MYYSCEETGRTGLMNRSVCRVRGHQGPQTLFEVNVSPWKAADLS